MTTIKPIKDYVQNLFDKKQIFEQEVDLPSFKMTKEDFRNDVLTAIEDTVIVNMESGKEPYKFAKYFPDSTYEDIRKAEKAYIDGGKISETDKKLMYYAHKFLGQEIVKDEDLLTRELRGRITKKAFVSGVSMRLLGSFKSLEIEQSMLTNSNYRQFERSALFAGEEKEFRSKLEKIASSLFILEHTQPHLANQVNISLKEEVRQNPQSNTLVKDIDLLVKNPTPNMRELIKEFSPEAAKLLKEDPKDKIMQELEEHYGSAKTAKIR